MRRGTIQPRKNLLRPLTQPHAVVPAPPARPQQSELGSLLMQLRTRQSRPGSAVRANFNSALEALWVNRTRSLLTALGIFIGVAAVIAALTLTQGVSGFITNQLASLGSNTIIIFPGTQRGARGVSSNASVKSLTMRDIQLTQNVEHVTGISPLVASSAQVIYRNQNYSTTVEGVSVDFQTIQNWQLSQGLWFTQYDESGGKTVAVIGDTLAHKLFDTSGADPVGQTVRVGNDIFKIVGVLEPKGGSFGQDNILLMPASTALSRFKNSIYIDGIMAQVDSAEHVPQAQQEMSEIIRQNHRIPNGGVDDFQTINSQQILDQLALQTQILTFLLVGIASISLTVGGIGIMNIMLVSVTERTREIGIRMSMGARRADIRNQFLIESLVLCLIGGTVGMLVGMSGGFLLTSSFGMPFVVTPTSIIVPFAISTVIGIVFGLYPAVRASKLDPIVALRRAK